MSLAQRTPLVSLPILTKEEHELLFRLAERLVGLRQDHADRHTVIATNVASRMQQSGYGTLISYLHYAESNSSEFSELIYSLTIHTTSFFRERHHFTALATILEETKPSFFSLLCMACSTGEEVYSYAMVLEAYRLKNPRFSYRIDGKDIDQVSISFAQRCIYSDSTLEQIPPEYRQFLLVGRGPTQGLLTLDKEIRSRCFFTVASLQEQALARQEAYELISCRNVLIYFPDGQVTNIIADLLRQLRQGGTLILGTSEIANTQALNLTHIGKSVYRLRAKAKALSADAEAKSRKDEVRTPVVLVVDDAPTIRMILQKLISSAGYIVYTVDSAAEASRVIKTKGHIDLVALDLNMPGQSGVDWLKEQRRSGLRCPVVIVSGSSAKEADVVIGALEQGAQDYIEKQELNRHPEQTLARMQALVMKYRVIPKTVSRLEAVNKMKSPLKRSDVVLIGASTGGTSALIVLLSRLPLNFPPLLVVQHLPAEFLDAFARRLASSSGLKLGEAIDGVPLERGTIYMATGDYHIGIRLKAGNLQLALLNMRPSHGHRPAVDMLFKSGVDASKAGLSITAVLLTGMGQDGAEGMASLHTVGATTIAQNEESSIIFGMPKAAIDRGAVDLVGDLKDIRSWLLKT